MSERTLDETLAKRAKRRALYERDVKDWTLDELVEVLTDRYTADPVPACRLCGADLSVQSMGSSGPTVYNCDGREPDPDRPGHLRWREGRTPADEHYVRSEYEEHKHGDDDVLEAIRRLKELDQKNKEHSGHRPSVAALLSESDG